MELTQWKSCLCKPWNGCLNCCNSRITSDKKKESSQLFILAAKWKTTEEIIPVNKAFLHSAFGSFGPSGAVTSNTMGRPLYEVLTMEPL